MTRVIGIMSGTSLDGIDICYTKIDANNFEIINYIEVDYLDDIKLKISRAIAGKMTLSQLTSLDYELGYEYSRALKIAYDNFKITTSDVDLIANHGQTIYHNDNKPGTISSTMQLGCGDIIKEQLSADVVNNFRAADIAVGNKGAPLVQIFDKYLVESRNLEDCSFLNIGGIANIYIAEANQSFDTGPGNMMINYAVKKLYDQEYDTDGLIAASGETNQLMLEMLLDHRYFQREDQLSTGREDFGDDYTKQVIDEFRMLSNEDIVATLTRFTADSIAKEFLKKVADKKQTIYVSGGGAYNKTLLMFLNQNFKNTKVVAIDEIGIGANLKEAAAFAYFGYANYNNIKLETQNGQMTILGVLHRRG